MELYRIQLRERQQEASESLPELGQHIRRLTNLAYPTVPADVRETLAKDQFVDALANSDMRLRIKQARPVNLNDAVRHAVELEAYFKAEGKLRENRGYVQNVDATERAQPKETGAIHSMLDELRQSMKQLEKKMKSIEAKGASPREEKTVRPNWRKNITCHNCGGKGHLKRECRKPKGNLSKGTTEEKQGSSANGNLVKMGT